LMLGCMLTRSDIQILAGIDGRGVLHHECGNYGIGRAAGARRSIQSFYWWHHQTAWEDGKTDLRKCISLEQM